jgi:hypothetical protein
MTKSLGRKGATIAAVLLMVVSSQQTMACAVCYGRSDSDLAKGMNMGILSLLIIITSVLAGIATCAYFLSRRMARYAQTAEMQDLAETPTQL